MSRISITTVFLVLVSAFIAWFGMDDIGDFFSHPLRVFIVMVSLIVLGILSAAIMSLVEYRRKRFLNSKNKKKNAKRSNQRAA